MSVFTNYKKQTLSVANRNASIIGALAGRTIGEVGQLHQLEGDEFEFEEKENPKQQGQFIRNLYLAIGGIEWQISLSKGFSWDKRGDSDWLMNCEFYKTFVAVKEADGTIQMDDQNKPILMDGIDGRELKEQIILGNPSGLVKGPNVEKAFNVEHSEAKAANAAINA